MASVIVEDDEPAYTRDRGKPRDAHLRGFLELKGGGLYGKSRV
jgi:hypothetical protein